VEKNPKCLVEIFGELYVSNIVYLFLLNVHIDLTIKRAIGHVALSPMLKKVARLSILFKCVGID